LFIHIKLGYKGFVKRLQLRLTRQKQQAHIANSYHINSSR